MAQAVQGSLDRGSVALIAAHAAHMSAPTEIEAAFDMPRYNAAKNFGLEDYGLYEGAVANLMVIDAKSAVDALRRRGDRRYVIREGRVLVETRRQLQWHEQENN